MENQPTVTKNWMIGAIYATYYNKELLVAVVFLCSAGGIGEQRLAKVQQHRSLQGKELKGFWWVLWAVRWRQPFASFPEDFEISEYF